MKILQKIVYPSNDHFKRIQKRIEANKPLSPDSLYEFALARGWVTPQDSKNHFISALRTLKDDADELTTKQILSFMYYAYKLYNNIPLAINSIHMRAYVKYVTGIRKCAKTKKFDYIVHTLVGIDYMLGNYNFDYIFENRNELYKNKKIDMYFYEWLNMFAEFDYIVRNKETYFIKHKKSPNKRLDELTALGFEHYPVYATRFAYPNERKINRMNNNINRNLGGGF